jgi:hypothetical protein
MLSDVVLHVRELKDIEILKSYFLLIWSEWRSPALNRPSSEMKISIRDDFGGIGAEHHRKELVDRLDHILGQLDQGLGHFRRAYPSDR